MPHKKMKLGELLIGAGIIDKFQLDSALSYQRNWGGRLGACLVRLGYVSEEELLGFLADQLKLPRIDLAGRTIPPEVLAYVPAAGARKYNILPVDRREMHGTLFLLVAMSDPTNLTVIDDLQFMTGCQVRSALAAEASIHEAIERCYGPAPAEESPVSVETAAVEEVPEGLSPVWQPVSNRAETTEEKLQRLLKILSEKGILSLRDYERLK